MISSEYKIIQITAAAEKHGNLNLRSCGSSFFPMDVHGGTNRKNSASRKLRIILPDDERSTYVLELILAMRKQGWFWTEEFIWHKKNCYPGKWPNRFRDAWERLLQFNKTRQFAMYQKAVMVPMGEWKHKYFRTYKKR